MINCWRKQFLVYVRKYNKIKYKEGVTELNIYYYVVVVLLRRFIYCTACGYSISLCFHKFRKINQLGSVMVPQIGIK